VGSGIACTTKRRTDPGCDRIPPFPGSRFGCRSSPRDCYLGECSIAATRPATNPRANRAASPTATGTLRPRCTPGRRCASACSFAPSARPMTCCKRCGVGRTRSATALIPPRESSDPGSSPSRRTCSSKSSSGRNPRRTNKSPHGAGDNATWFVRGAACPVTMGGAGTERGASPRTDTQRATVRRFPSSWARH